MPQLRERGGSDRKAARSRPLRSTEAMPHKYHAERRHHIPKVQYRVRNWREYEAGLRRRGSLTIWITEDAVEAWRAAARTTPGGQARYSDLAITTSLVQPAENDCPSRSVLC
jgi:DDE family transposase